jgi:hypothetical protein
MPGSPPTVNDLLKSLDRYDSPIDMSEVASAYGVTLTSSTISCTIS